MTKNRSINEKLDFITYLFILFTYLFMKKKIICEANLNSIVANTKADKAIKAIRNESPNFLAEAPIENEVKLRKVTLRESAFNAPAGSPLYVFMKRASKKLTVVVDVETGKAKVIPTSIIDSNVAVTGRFEINGVTYELKDTMNGCPRYRACGSKFKSRAKALLKKSLMDVDLFRVRIGL